MLRIHHEDPKTRSLDDDCEVIAGRIVQAAFVVHSTLGPGLLEGVYEACLAHELKKRDLEGESQIALPVVYDGLRIEAGLRLDMRVERQVIIEIKAVEALLPVHKAQLLTYLKLTRLRLGFFDQFQYAAYQTRHQTNRFMISSCLRVFVAILF